MEQQASSLWKQSYSVGDLTLDHQHRMLLNLCLQVSSYDEGPFRDTGQFHEVLNGLASYVDQHFKIEEAFLSRWRYPLLEAHQAEHLDYRDRLTEYLYKATVGNISADQLRRYLTSWWLEHILGSDMSYAQYRRQQH